VYSRLCAGSFVRLLIRVVRMCVTLFVLAALHLTNVTPVSGSSCCSLWNSLELSLWNSLSRTLSNSPELSLSRTLSNSLSLPNSLSLELWNSQPSEEQEELSERSPSGE
jgi:hypothetical protein